MKILKKKNSYCFSGKRRGPWVICVEKSGCVPYSYGQILYPLKLQAHYDNIECISSYTSLKVCLDEYQYLSN